MSAIGSQYDQPDVADQALAIAAGIFLDIFNVFLLLLSVFGGGRD